MGAVTLKKIIFSQVQNKHYMAHYMPIEIKVVLWVKSSPPHGGEAL